MAQQTALNTFLGVVPANCEVRFIAPTRGNGLFTQRDINKGDVVFTEKPLVSIQQAYNRQEAWCCAHCRAFLGSLDEQLAVHLGLSKMKIKSNIHLPQSETFHVKTESVDCLGGCGEKYCSENCRDLAFAQYHNLLCVGQLSSTEHPLYQFKQYALENNELLLIIAQYIARILTSWLDSGKTLNIEEIQHKILKQFTHKLWWEMYHESFSEDELRKMSQESLELLKMAFFTMMGGNTLSRSDIAALSPLFEYEFFVKLLALLEINEIAIGITSPLEPYRKNIEKLPEKEKDVAQAILGPLMERLIAQQREECGEEEEGEDTEMKEEGEEEGENNDEAMEEDPIFPNFEGIGVYPATAMMNHSCEPNCIVNFGKNSELIMNALRPIKIGEELLLSYIVESAPLEDRQIELKPYGFVCDCNKCKTEQKAE